MAANEHKNDIEMQEIPPSPFGDESTDYLGEHMSVSCVYERDESDGEFHLSSFNPRTIWQEMLSNERLGLVACGGRIDPETIARREKSEQRYPIMCSDLCDALTVYKLIPDGVDTLVAIGLDTLTDIHEVNYVLEATSATLVYASAKHDESVYKPWDFINVCNNSTKPHSYLEDKYVKYAGKMTPEIIDSVAKALVSRRAQECVLSYELLCYGQGVRDPRSKLDVKDMTKAVRTLSFGMLGVDKGELRTLSLNQQKAALAYLDSDIETLQPAITKYYQLHGLCKIWDSAIKRYVGHGHRYRPVGRKLNMRGMHRVSEELECVDMMVESMMAGVPVEDIVA